MEVAEPTDEPEDDSPQQISVPPLVMEAFVRAQSRSVPLIIDFSASWCLPCQRFKNETLADESVASLLEESAVLLEIDTDEHPEIAKQFGIVSLPEIVFLSPTGKEVQRISEFQDVETFTATVNAVIEDIPQDVTGEPRPLSDMTDGHGPLKEKFNDQAGNVRMIVILSPS